MLPIITIMTFPLFFIFIFISLSLPLSGHLSLGQTCHSIGYSTGCKLLLCTDGASPRKENSLQVATDSPSTAQGESHTHSHTIKNANTRLLFNTELFWLGWRSGIRVMRTISCDDFNAGSYLVHWKGHCLRFIHAQRKGKNCTFWTME